MASQDWFEKDFYAILGVSPEATDAEIKKAYRKLARTWHPDQNPGDDAAEKRFKEIGEANAVLSDPEERRQYDAVRQMATGRARFTAGGPGQGTGGAGFEDIFGSMFSGGAPGGGGQRMRYSTGSNGGGQGINIEDLLGGFAGGGGGSPFGGGGYGGYGAPAGPRPGQDLQARTSLTFRQAAEGAMVTLQGADGKKITTRIPAGVKDGQTIRLRGKGREGDPGAARGDLMLSVKVEPHPVFAREGNNLTLELPVTFAEAALGATVEVPTLDGKPVRLKVAPGTPSGRVLRVKGRGIQAKGGAGDLLAKVVVIVPQRLSDEAKQALEVMAEQEKDIDPRADLKAKASS